MQPDATAPARFDRWVTLSIVAPVARLMPLEAGIAIPILMYHSIADDVDDTVHPYFRTVTSRARFAEQIEFLRQAGYEAVTLSRALRMLHDPACAAAGDRKPVVLTFDDGFRDFHAHAHPILERAGFAATVFLSSAYIDKPFLTGRDCLRTSEVRELCDKGIEFGSHSVSHRRLVELARNELVREVAESKRAIEDITGREVTLFSYPYRFPEENLAFTQTLGGLLDESGYKAGVTTAIGRSRPQDDRRFLPRLPMNDCDDMRLLRAKLDGHYDWLRTGQLMRKRSRALMRRWKAS
jgi:peptidoglycan/xylan/chitin deacetylase (PgdA/CDA1 family)